MFKLLVHYERQGDRIKIFITGTCITANRLDMLLYCHSINFLDGVRDNFLSFFHKSSLYDAAIVDFVIDVLKSHRTPLSNYLDDDDDIHMHLDIYEHLLRRDMFVYDPSSESLSAKASIYFIVERRVDLMMYPYIRKLLQSLTAVSVSLNHKGEELGRTPNKVLINALDEYDKKRKDAELVITECTGLPQDVVNFVLLELL